MANTPFNKDTVVVFGISGQVGNALMALLNKNAVGFSREQADFSTPESVAALLKQLPFTPKAVINAAAYTAVDKAEEEKERAYTVNAETPEAIAAYCKDKDIPFIHYSTDYVFPGTGDTAWNEAAATAPLNAYGKTKCTGEEKIAGIGGKYLIFRTSWVYDSQGKNFLNTMLRLGKERDSLQVVGDQYGAPTYAPHLAAATLEILEKTGEIQPFPSGIYHVCNQGVTTWHGFSQAIFTTARKYGIPLKLTQVTDIPSSAYPTPAKRPLNSRLDCTKAQRSFGVTLPSWQEGVELAIHEKISLEEVA